MLTVAIDEDHNPHLHKEKKTKEPPGHYFSNKVFVLFKNFGGG